MFSINNNLNNKYKNLNHTTRINRFRKSLKPSYNFYWLIIAAFICSFIYIFSLKPLIPKVEEGEIANTTIKAMEEFSFIDHEATEARREEARQAVAPVYDYDPLLKLQVLSNLKALFDEGNKFIQWQDSILKEQHNNKKTIILENANLFKQTVKNVLKIELNDEISNALIFDNFSEDIKAKLAEIIDECMKNKIISDKKNIQFNTKGEFVLRDIVSSKETKKTSAIDIYSIAEIDNLIDNLLIKNENLFNKAHLPAYSKLLKLIIVPSVNFNSQETLHRREEARENSEPVIIQVKKGQVIVREGDVISQKHIRLLEYLRQNKKEYESLRHYLFIITVVCFGLFFIHIISNNYPIHNILLRDKNILLLIVFVYILNLIILRGFQVLLEAPSNLFTSSPYNDPAEYFYIIPFSLGALSIAILINSQLALAYSLIFSLTSVLLINGDLERFMYILVTNVVASFSIGSYRQRSDLVKAGLKIAIINVCFILYIQLLYQEFLSLNYLLFRVLLGFLSGIIAYIIASGIIPFIESAFHILTDFKLIELSSINLPLIRELALKAPGTYHHSIVVSVLAEGAADSIKVNSLFVKVAALYHDAGKIVNPELYIENQKGRNVHESHSPLKSAKLIISHINEGYEVAKKNKLPKDVINLIMQHHGTKLVSYFYSKALELAKNDDKPNPDDFRYPGPKPLSKESAILMIADAVEAASRTIEHADYDTIKNLVDRIIKDCFEDKQLDECNINIKELDIIAQSMIEILFDMKHGRIDYPGYDFRHSIKDTNNGQNKLINLPDDVKE